MEALLDRGVVIALAVAGGALALLASFLQVRGIVGTKGARNLNYAGYALMGASMLLFALAGLWGVPA
jgi:hypothetical protein